MIATIIILSIFVFILLGLLYMYITRYNIVKIDYDELEPKFKYISSRITFIGNKLKVIDASGHFESDDEVGFFFTELKALQLMLAEYNAFFYQIGDENLVKQMTKIKQQLNELENNSSNSEF